MKPGRLATVAAIAMLLVGGLTACRADPAVAAYVDDVRITQAEVDDVVESLNELLTAETDQNLTQLRELLDQQAREDETFTQEQADEQYTEVEDAERDSVTQRLSTIRDRVLEMRILTIATTDYLEAAGLTVPEPAIEHHAAELGLPADHPYVAVVADYFAVMGVLQAQAASAEPSEDDRREIYDNLVADGLTDVPYEEARDVLTAELVGEAVGMRNLIRDVLDEVRIQLNPRYQLVYQVPVRFAGSEVTSLGIPLGDSAIRTTR